MMTMPDVAPPTSILSVTPCAVCGIRIPRRLDDMARLCGHCLADLPQIRAHVDDQLAALDRRGEELTARWLDQQTFLGDDLAQRWTRLVQTREAARTRLVRAQHAPVHVSRVLEANQEREAAKAAWAKVLRRIAETCVAVPEIAALVDAEDRYVTATRELRQQIKHWLIARQEVDVAEDAARVEVRGAPDAKL